MSVTLWGIGKAVPPFTIEQHEAARAAMQFCMPEEGRFVEALYGLTRIQRRASVVLEKESAGTPVQSFFQARQGPGDRGPDTHSRMQCYAQKAPALALEASRQALSAAGISAEEIDKLITVTCTGFSAPGFDISLIKELPLSPETQRVQVGFMGCHGMFNALQAASALARSAPREKILVCSVELCSLHFSYAEGYDQQLSNAIFADGSSAAVLSCVSEAGKWKLAATGSCIFPDSEAAMRWDIGNHGFQMVLSDKVPALLAKNLKPWLSHWLTAQGLSLDTVGSWAIHPGGPRILDQIEMSLDLPAEALEPSRRILTHYGNMSSATILFVLDLLQQQDAPRPCVALAFGPGLTAEVALFL